MGGWNFNRVLSPEVTHFQSGINQQSHLYTAPEKDVRASHMLCDCEAIAYLRFRHMGHYSVEILRRHFV
jgi:hypothetical protein